MGAKNGQDVHSAHDAENAGSDLQQAERDQTTAEDPGGTNFFSLSAELRNRIYEETLVKKGHVEIYHRPDLKEPGLLSACRQIRCEARSIWWLQNIFKTQVSSCDTTLLTAFIKRMAELCAKYKVREITGPSIFMMGTPNWTNLMDWCRKVHTKGGQTLYIKEGGNEPMCTVVASATSLADHLLTQGSSWQACRVAPELMRPSFGLLDNGWLAT